MLRALLVAAFVSCGLSRDVSDNYFYGRSGDLLIRPTESDSTIVFLSEFDLVRQSADSQLAVEDVAGVVARSLGVLPPAHSSAPSFLHTTFFHRAQANLLIALDGVGSSTFDDMPNLRALNRGSFPKGQAQALSLEQGECISDSVGLLSCLSSGFLAADTGIVGSAWKGVNGSPVNAFSSNDLWSAKANLADRVVQSFDGQSLTLSFASDKQKASSFCIHPRLAKLASNSFCLEPSTVSEDISLPRSKDDLVEVFGRGAPDSLLSALSDNGLNTEFASGAVSVPVKDAHVALDLSVPEDLNLLLEVQSFHSVSRALASNPRLNGLVKDDAPDAYFATFSALGPMTAKYGVDAPKVTAARRIVDASVAVFLRSWAQLYESKLLAEVATLGSPVDMSTALRKVQELAPQLTGLKDYFPAVYIPQSNTQLCESVQEKLKGTFDVTCFLPELAARGRSLLQAPTNAPTPQPVVSPEERERYQIMVWVSVAGAFTVLFAFYSTAFMSFKKDTLLYSTFNPKWDDRKTK